MEMNLNKIHFEQTNLQREQNLREDLKVWEFINNLNENDNRFKIVGINDEDKFKIEYSDHSTRKELSHILSRKITEFSGAKDAISFFKGRVITLCKKIWNKRSRNFNLRSENQMNLKIVKKFTRFLTNSPTEIQLEFCRPPEKQSINEKISFQTLKKYLNKDFWTIEKPSNGEWSVEDEKISQNNKSERILVSKARSVDFIIRSKKNRDLEFFGFAKFSKDKGSSQGLQTEEAKIFVFEAKKYVEVNINKKYFFCLIDGKQGATAIKQLKKLVSRFNDRIYIGNSFEIIKKISEHEV